MFFEQFRKIYFYITERIKEYEVLLKLVLRPLKALI
jgi:hypothetical protein